MSIRSLDLRSLSGYPKQTDDCRVARVIGRSRRVARGLGLFWVLSESGRRLEESRAELPPAVLRLEATRHELWRCCTDRRTPAVVLKRAERAIARFVHESYETRERIVAVLEIRLGEYRAAHLAGSLKAPRRRAAAAARMLTVTGNAALVRSSNKVMRVCESDALIRNVRTHETYPTLVLDDGVWLHDPFQYLCETRGTPRRVIAEHTVRVLTSQFCRRYATRANGLIRAVESFRRIEQRWQT
jgi:hypothetical protein